MAASEAPTADADEKWRRALLKKLRSAAGVRARVAAGDAASLQRSQAPKADAVDALVARCEAAGRPRDGARVTDAMRAGEAEGAAAMAAAKKREAAATRGCARSAAARGAAKDLPVRLRTGVTRAIARVAVDRTACIFVLV